MRTRLVAVTTLALLVALLLAGCRSECASKMEGTAREMVLIAKSRPIEGQTVTATFADGQIKGNLGCNDYFGSYDLEGDKLTIDDWNMTERRCPEPIGIMEQDSMLARYLQDVASWRIEDNRLYLRTSAGKELTFERVE